MKMTDKERLEMIKGIQKIIKECQEKGKNVSNLHSDYVDWLIERAEKAEQLELEINDWRAEVQKWQQFYEESEKSHLETLELLKSIANQNKRYRKAINDTVE